MKNQKHPYSRQTRWGFKVRNSDWWPVLNLQVYRNYRHIDEKADSVVPKLIFWYLIQIFHTPITGAITRIKGLLFVVLKATQNDLRSISSQFCTCSWPWTTALDLSVDPYWSNFMFDHTMARSCVRLWTASLGYSYLCRSGWWLY